MELGSKKGQITVVNIVMFFVAAIVLFALLPTLVSTADASISDAGLSGTITETIVDLFPFLFVISLVITVIVYSGITQERRY